MQSLWRWLASLFHTEIIWIDRGQGRWRRRRQYHPVLRIFFIAVVLALLWGGAELYPYRFQIRDLLFRGDGEETEALDAVLPVHGGRAPLLGIHDFPYEPASADPSPGPIPFGLVVEEGEYWLRVSKKDYRLYLYRGNEVDRAYLVAVGKNPGDKERAGDNRTPNGIFTVQSIENASSWTHDFRDGKGIIRGAYGPWFIRLRTGWQGIGIHGTHDPASRGAMISEGCIRMLNEELEELKQFAFRNMKVVIEE